VFALFFEQETAPCVESLRVCEWVMNFEVMVLYVHQTDEKTRGGEVSAGSELIRNYEQKWYHIT
jgi:hypothetical protein